MCPRLLSRVLVHLVSSRKATVSVVISVCMYVRMEQLGSYMMDFHEIWYLSVSPKCVLTF